MRYYLGTKDFSQHIVSLHPGRGPARLRPHRPVHRRAVANTRMGAARRLDQETSLGKSEAEEMWSRPRSGRAYNATDCQEPSPALPSCGAGPAPADRAGPEPTLSDRPKRDRGRELRANVENPARGRLDRCGRWSARGRGPNLCQVSGIWTENWNPGTGPGPGRLLRAITASRFPMNHAAINLALTFRRDPCGDRIACEASQSGRSTTAHFGNPGVAHPGQFPESLSPSFDEAPSNRRQ